jgi:hypothetical protein
METPIMVTIRLLVIILLIMRSLLAGRASRGGRGPALHKGWRGRRPVAMMIT